MIDVAVPAVAADVAVPPDVAAVALAAVAAAEIVVAVVAVHDFFVIDLIRFGVRQVAE